MTHAPAPHWSHPIRPAELAPNRATAFDIAPTPDETAAIAGALDLPGLSAVRFRGAIEPAGQRDWRLQGTLEAQVTQPCVVTLAPVTTRLSLPVERLYLAEFDEPEAGPDAEIEMPDDDHVEAVPARLDLAGVAIEALSLGLPEYPRADGAALGETRFTEPGKTALSDEDARPFAALKSLRDKLGKDD